MGTLASIRERCWGGGPSPQSMVNRSVLFKERENRAYASTDLVGLELEVENVSQEYRNLITRNRRYWRWIRDNSLLRDNFSYEFVFSRPFRTSALAKAINILGKAFSNVPTDILREWRSYRTSTHAHINMLDSTPEELTTTLLIYCALEPALLKYYYNLDNYRDSNIYCIPMTKCYKQMRLVRRLLKSVGNRDGGDIVSEVAIAVAELYNDGDRYAALNLCALYKFGTLEFRAPPALLDINEIVRLIKIIQVLKHAGRKLANDYKAMEMLFSEGRIGEGDTSILNYFKEVCATKGYTSLYEAFFSSFPRHELEEAEIMVLSYSV